MKNKKIYIFLILILAVYLGVFLLLFNKKSNNSNDGYKYLILDNNGNFSYSSSGFQKISNSEIEKLNMNFNAYSDNNYLGKYTLKYGANWNLFDSNNIFYKYDGYLFAYSSNFNLKKNNVSGRTLNDDDKSFLLEKFKINDYSSLLTNKVYDIDMNNDNVLDEVICLSNIDNNNISKNYNLVLVKTNNSYNTLVNQKGENVTDVYDIKVFFKKDSSSYYYFVLENINGYESDSQTIINTIYSYKDNKFKKIISN